MKDLIIELASNLNKERILWGIGGSVLLKSYGIVEEVQDLDIIVSASDIQTALQVLDRIAISQEVPINTAYKTEYFSVYMFKGLSIDVMSSFRINHSKGIYEFVLDDKAIVKKDMVGNVVIPYTSLEDWFTAYRLMTGRENKVALIKDYLTLNGVSHPELLQRSLKQALPEGLKSEIGGLLK